MTEQRNIGQRKLIGRKTVAPAPENILRLGHVFFSKVQNLMKNYIAAMLGGLFLSACGIAEEVFDKADGTRSLVLMLANNGVSSVEGVYLLEKGKTEWSHNKLTSGRAVRPGTVRKFFVNDGNGPCVYSLRVFFADDTATNAKTYDLCEIQRDNSIVRGYAYVNAIPPRPPQ